MPQTWPVTRGHESGTATQKMIEWKGDSDESQMDKCGSDGEVEVRLYEVCILVNSHVAGQTKKGVHQMIQLESWY